MAHTTIPWVILIYVSATIFAAGIGLGLAAATLDARKDAAERKDVANDKTVIVTPYWLLGLIVDSPEYLMRSQIMDLLVGLAVGEHLTREDIRESTWPEHLGISDGQLAVDSALFVLGRYGAILNSSIEEDEQHWEVSDEGRRIWTNYRHQQFEAEAYAMLEAEQSA